MTGFPTKQEIERTRRMYPVGCRVELVLTDDPFTSLWPGSQGVVDHIDGAGQVGIQWDSGSNLSLIPGVDSFKRID